MLKHIVELREDQLRLLNGLIIAEARRLRYKDYQRPSEYPPRLKKLVSVWRVVNAWRYEMLPDGIVVRRGTR